MAGNNAKLAERIWRALKDARDSPEYAKLKRDADVVD